MERRAIMGGNGDALSRSERRACPRRPFARSTAHPPRWKIGLTTEAGGRSSRANHALTGVVKRLAYCTLNACPRPTASAPDGPQ